MTMKQVGGLRIPEHRPRMHYFGAGYRQTLSRQEINEPIIIQPHRNCTLDSSEIKELIETVNNSSKTSAERTLAKTTLIKNNIVENKYYESD